MGGELPRVYYRTLDPFVVLTAAATVTENLLLGTGIALLAQRDVIHTAKEVASLDLVSGDRVVLAHARMWSLVRGAPDEAAPAFRRPNRSAIALPEGRSPAGVRPATAVFEGADC